MKNKKKMTNEEIKLECEKMYLQISDAEDRLKKMRSICKHEKTFDKKLNKLLNKEGTHKE